tara:strand:+ start:89 stop:349 length:261 start_codon:yes stop_codon:yes gene_type:complete
MKKITLILIMTTSLMSFKQPDFVVSKATYDMRLTWMQERCRMLEDMFEEQYKAGEMKAEFAMFYMKMIQSVDSCAGSMSHFKVLFK